MIAHEISRVHTTAEASIDHEQNYECYDGVKSVLEGCRSPMRCYMK